jgi:hypothetical protein
MDNIGLIERLVGRKFENPPQVRKNTAFNRFFVGLRTEKGRSFIKGVEALRNCGEFGFYNGHANTIVKSKRDNRTLRFVELLGFAFAYIRTSYPDLSKKTLEADRRFLEIYVKGSLDISDVERYVCAVNLEKGLAYHIAVESEKLTMDGDPPHLYCFELEYILVKGYRIVNPGDRAPKEDTPSIKCLIGSVEKAVDEFMKEYANNSERTHSSFRRDIKNIKYWIPRLGYRCVRNYMQDAPIEHVDRIANLDANFKTFREVFVGK